MKNIVRGLPNIAHCTNRRSLSFCYVDNFRVWILVKFNLDQNMDQFHNGSILELHMWYLDRCSAFKQCFWEGVHPPLIAHSNVFPARSISKLLSGSDKPGLPVATNGSLTSHRRSRTSCGLLTAVAPLNSFSLHDDTCADRSNRWPGRWRRA